MPVVEGEDLTLALAHLVGQVAAVQVETQVAQLQHRGLTILAAVAEALPDLQMQLTLVLTAAPAS
jgi:hypothetical protein